MKLNEFKKLENTIQNQDFNKSYRNINQVMFYLSIFGQLASIFLAYFLVSKVLASAIDNTVLVLIASIVLLGGLELLKREIFDKFSLNQLKTKSLTSKDVIYLLVTSLILISLSFYSSLKGAEEFSSKSKEIEIKADTTISKFEDSLKLRMNDGLKSVDSEINQLKSKIEDKDKEQTALEANQPLGFQQRNRVKDLKQEKSELRLEINKLEDSKKSSKTELDKQLQEFKDKIEKKSIREKKENRTNSFLFIVISTIIELLILSGVYFNQYYTFRSYDEYKKKIEKDPNFQKWVNYNIVLDVIFSSESKINDRLPSNKTIQELCKVNGLILLNKDMVELTKLFLSLGIIKSSGSSKYIGKTKENSQESLRVYFKID